MEMHKVVMYMTGIWTATFLSVGLVKAGVIKIQWPTLQSAPRHNTFVKWISVFGFSTAFAMGFRFSITSTFDQSALVNVVSAFLNLLGFALATFSVLASANVKAFLADVVVNAIAWLSITMPVGFMVAGGTFSLVRSTHGGAVCNFGFAMFSMASPLILMIEWSLKHQTTEARLNWSAATLLLLAALLQLAVAMSIFID